MALTLPGSIAASSSRESPSSSVLLIETPEQRRLPESVCHDVSPLAPISLARPKVAADKAPPVSVACEGYCAGTCEWVAGLMKGDVYVERITRNVLDRFTG